MTSKPFVAIWLLAKDDAVLDGESEARPRAAPQHALPYLNRLSDLLFVLSRQINQGDSTNETCWER